MHIGFMVNQIDTRGTTWAALEYARAARDIGGHDAILIDRGCAAPDAQMVDYLASQCFAPCGLPVAIETLYYIKSGECDGYRPPGVGRYCVHAVFDATCPHGNTFAAVSDWLGRRDDAPAVPHIVTLPDTSASWRESLGIPATATVFGRYGGWDTFDVPFVWDAIHQTVSRRPDVWFVFVNTEPRLDHPRVIYHAPITNPWAKRGFINTCDAMLHARARGETFGMACGEFAICGKPVLTYGKSGERAHIEMLDSKGYCYDTCDELVELLIEWDWKTLDTDMHTAYHDCTPPNVWRKFEEVFLS